MQMSTRKTETASVLYQDGIDIPVSITGNVYLPQVSGFDDTPEADDLTATVTEDIAKHDATDNPVTGEYEYRTGQVLELDPTECEALAGKLIEAAQAAA